jgi:tRNA(Ile)-lysidine synthase
LKKSLEVFLSDLKSQNLMPSRFLVGYSGGLDSTVLLHLLHDMDIPVYAVHVNHQIQQQSNVWEQHCKDQCEQWSIPFVGLQVKVELTGFGLEAQARQVRYRSIFEWMNMNNHNLLLCAHHLDDQVETILLQLFRGSGLRGIGGMRRLGPVGVDRYLHPELLLGRPLLNHPRADLLSYAKKNKLKFIEDPSNSDMTFRRNWVRHELIPSLKQRFPQSPKALLQLAEYFQSHYFAQDLQVDELANQMISDEGKLQLIHWRKLNEFEQLDLLRHWLLGQGIRCSKSNLLELARQLKNEKGGVREVNRGWQVRINKHLATLCLIKTKGV